MGHLSSRDKAFISIAQQWLKEQGEIFVMLRYSHAAGSKGFEFFKSLESFSSRLQSLAPRTSIIVFREPQLPLRGVVEDSLIEAALMAIPNGVEFLVVDLAPETYGKYSW